jgi:hypothetical protein
MLGFKIGLKGFLATPFKSLRAFFIALSRLEGQACGIPHPRFPDEDRSFAKLHAPF